VLPKLGAIDCIYPSNLIDITLITKYIEAFLFSFFYVLFFGKSWLVVNFSNMPTVILGMRYLFVVMMKSRN
jgi:hypothetical protein